MNPDNMKWFSVVGVFFLWTVFLFSTFNWAVESREQAAYKLGWDYRMNEECDAFVQDYQSGNFEYAKLYIETLVSYCDQGFQDRIK